MSLKKIIGSSALSFFDMLGINQKSGKINNEEKNKRKKRKKSIKQTKAPATQLNLFNLTYETETSNLIKDSSAKKTSVISNMTQFSMFRDDFSSNTAVPLVAPDKDKISSPMVQDYKITAADKLGMGSLKQKCLDNIIAIETMISLENTNESISKKEQKKLVRFVGWGGLAQKVFSSDVDMNWMPLAKRIKSLLSKEEYSDASRSSLTAFYTPKELITFMYHALDKMGFSGGRILEPSCGIGHFVGCIPEKLKGHIKLTAVELDNISSRIATLLYPNSKIYNMGFEKCKFEDSSYDCIIGNVPFGNYKVYDKRYKNLNFKIHNYFFAKALDLVRAGGLIAFITTHYTMDSKDDFVRRYISSRANLIAAVRLPVSAFKTADTKIVSDIIFLQKRLPYSKYSGKCWIKAKDKFGINLNEYFIDNPKMVMGNMHLDTHTNQFGRHELIVENKDNTLSSLLNSVLKNFPKNIYDEIENSSAYLFEKDELLSINDYPDVKESAFEFIDDKLYQRHGNKLVPVLTNTSALNRIRGLIQIKIALKNVIEFQTNNVSDVGLFELQHILNATYNEFVRNFKHINSIENKKAFGEDPSYPLLSSLEIQKSDGAFDKADIFSKRTIANKKEITHADSIEDALAISINSSLNIDFKYMSSLVEKPIYEIKDYLLDKQYIFKNPTTNYYETADEYLSGAVVEKLKLAKKADLSKDKEFKYNITALSKVQPIPLNFTHIDVKLGSSWVPPKYIKQFIIEILSIDEFNAEKFNVLYCNVNATWEINIPKVLPSINNYKNHSEYGTLRISAFKLVELSLNLKDAKIYDSIWNEEKSSYERKLNRKESVIARQKQSEIKLKFKDWIWQNEERRNLLTDLYNNLYNSWINRKIDGSKFEPRGISILAPKLRDYQKNAILRILYTGNTLLAHTVGSGKTMEMAVAGMELKRLGLCKKPMYIVPNALVESGQFAREFMQLYPTANLLVATSKDFSADKRKKFISRIALGDWDGVIISHSSFGLIPVSDNTKKKFIEKEISELVYALEDLDDNKSRTAKQLEKTKASLEEKLSAMADAPKDNNITFEQLGVDQIFTDESHNYKRLFLYSKLNNVAGIPTSGSNKAFDLYMKSQYVISMNKKKGRPNSGLVFATGTPLSNTMAEMYVLQKYLMGDELKRLNMYYFDSWASTFGDIISSIEISPTGAGYKSKLRFAKFNNVPELMSIFRRVSDIVTPDMLHLKDLPGSEYIDVELHKCPEVENYIQKLIKRADAISKGNVTPEQDNMLCVVNDGRKAALDPRLVGINVDYKGSKINSCVQKAYTLWKNHASEKATQIIFCDLGTPSGKKRILNLKSDNLLDISKFNIYEDIRLKLINLGVPDSEIAFIHDANTPIKKAKLFRDFREGSVRILLGSTSKCGEGCNIQDRIIAIHHLTCPWRPSDLIQRDGRGVRTGNLIGMKNGKVLIYRYATKGTFDGFSWQTIETKAKFINQIMNGTFKGRSIEDIDEQLLSFAQMKAICSENPLIAEKIKNDIEIQRLQALETGFKRQQYNSETCIKENEKYIKENTEYLKRLYTDVKLKNENKKLKFSINIKEYEFKEHVNADGNTVTGKKDAGEYILKLFQNLIEPDKKYKIGIYNGFEVFIEKHYNLEGFIENSVILSGSNKYHIDCFGLSGLGIIQRAETKLNSLEELIKKIENKISSKHSENTGYKSSLNQTFKLKGQLLGLQKRQAEIESMLNLNSSNSDLDFND